MRRSDVEKALLSIPSFIYPLHASHCKREVGSKKHQCMLKAAYNAFSCFLRWIHNTFLYLSSQLLLAVHKSDIIVVRIIRLLCLITISRAKAIGQQNLLLGEGLYVVVENLQRVKLWLILAAFFGTMLAVFGSAIVGRAGGA